MPPNNRNHRITRNSLDQDSRSDDSDAASLTPDNTGEQALLEVMSNRLPARGVSLPPTRSANTGSTSDSADALQAAAPRSLSLPQPNAVRTRAETDAAQALLSLGRERSRPGDPRVTEPRPRPGLPSVNPTLARLQPGNVPSNQSRRQSGNIPGAHDRRLRLLRARLQPRIRQIVAHLRSLRREHLDLDGLRRRDERQALNVFREARSQRLRETDCERIQREEDVEDALELLEHLGLRLIKLEDDMTYEARLMRELDWDEPRGA